MSLLLEVNDTAKEAYRYKKLLLIGILIDLPFYLSIIYIHFFITIPEHGYPGEQIAIIGMLSGLYALLVGSYLTAGYYGVIFLKLNSQKPDTKSFFYLSTKNFWRFILVGFLINFNGIIQVAVIFISGFLYEPKTGSFPTFWYINVIPVFNLLFFFSYCLVTMNRFSTRKLKPLKDSIKIVLKQPIKVILVYLMILYTLISGVVEHYYDILNNSYAYVLFTFWQLFFNSALTFFFIVYSFNKLTREIYPDLEYNFRGNKGSVETSDYKNQVIDDNPV